MKSIAAIKLKIPYKKELLETMKQYSQSAQYALDIGWDNGIYFKKEIHHLTYYPIRETLGLPAQLVCSSRDKACESLKALRKTKKPTKPRFKEFLTIRYDARSFTFKKNFVTLASVEGRAKINIEIPEYYKQYLSWKPRSADLVFDRKKRLFLHITFFRDTDTPINSFTNGFVGVDVGINHIAVTSNRQFFSGNKIKSYRLKYKRLKAKLQAKGTQSAKRLLRKISGKERRFKAWVNHNISRQIVDNCKAGTIALENIKGIRSNKGRKFNFWLHGWSFYQLQQFIEYKAFRKGIRVVKVSPYFTSQTCSRCGQVGSRSKGFFSCSHCGYSLNADLNASYNLAKQHSNTDVVSASVTKPHIQTDELEGSLRTIESEVMDKSPLF
tara:strand:+ start:3966 stop:5114 length:1149 start_codon:yes stop_codon:yes gene_type:complete